MTDIYVLIYDTKHGTDVMAYTTQKLAQEALDDILREDFFEDVFPDDRKEFGDTEEDQIEAWRDAGMRSGCDWITIEQVFLNVSTVEPPVLDVPNLSEGEGE